jgi:hypothetical protein
VWKKVPKEANSRDPPTITKDILNTFHRGFTLKFFTMVSSFIDNTLFDYAD